jgi:hypothetical protein
MIVWLCHASLASFMAVLLGHCRWSMCLFWCVADAPRVMAVQNGLEWSLLRAL